MTEPAFNDGHNEMALKGTLTEAAEKIKKLSEDLRTKIQGLQHGAEDKALGLLQTVENVSEKLHLKTEAEAKAFELLESVEGLSAKLQTYVDDFEAKFEDSQLQFHLGIMEAMERWEEVRTQAASVLHFVHIDTTPASKLIDEVKLRANLGAMETREFLDKGKTEISKAWQQVSHQSNLAMKQMNSSIGDMLNRFL